MVQQQRTLVIGSLLQSAMFVCTSLSLCTDMRLLSLLCNVQNERVLFHYNGHGVPRPTVNGEIWVFNKSYTQYIPMSIYDLQAWLGSPCIFVFDCSAAGLIVNSFKAFAEQKTQVGLLSPSNRFASQYIHPSMFIICPVIHTSISHSSNDLFIHIFVHLLHVTCFPKVRHVYRLACL